MRNKTKSQLQRAGIYFMIFLMVVTTVLLFLPFSQPAPESTAPPLESSVEVQQNPPQVPVGTGAPLGQ